MILLVELVEVELENFIRRDSKGPISTREGVGR